MKRLLILSTVLLGLMVVAGLGLRSYLRSHRVARQVTARLETLVGKPVRVENVDIGLNSTAISGLSFFEEGRETDAKGMWLKVGTLTMDVSLWDLFAGNAMPRQVQVQGATLVLHFDRRGNLLTRFTAPTDVVGTESTKSESLPGVLLEKSEVIFRKEGHADLIAKNIRAKVIHEEDRLVLSGTADNAELGALILNGSLDNNAQNLTVQIKTERKAHVTQAILERMPFVPDLVWREVHIAEGDTPAELVLRYERASNDLQYRLDLSAQNTTVAIPSIDLSAQSAHGKIIVENNQVQLRQVEGQTFGGFLRTDADLDFRGRSSKLAFKRIHVRDVNVSELPDNWQIPAQIRKIGAKGTLTGRASLELTISPYAYTARDAVKLVGAAHGLWSVAVSQLSVLGASEVHASGKGKAAVHGSAIGHEPIEFDWRIGTHAVPMSRGAANGGVRVASLLADEWLVRLLQEQTKKAPEKPAGNASDYVDLNLNLNNVSISEVLKNLEVKVPFALAGKASLKVKVSMSTGETKRFKATGAVQFTELEAAGIQLGDMNADLVYADGVLELTSLTSSLGDKKDPGTIRGSGRLELDPLGDLRANLIVDRVPIAKLIAVENGRLQGTVSGVLNLRGRSDKIGLDTVLADGKITGDGVVIDGMSLEQVSTSIKLDKGVVRMPDLQLRFEGTPVAAAGDFDLHDYSFRAKLDMQKWNLAALEKFSGLDKNLTVSVGGAFTTTAVIDGKLEPFQVGASGDARATQLKVDQFEAQSVQFHWKTDGKKLDLQNVKADLYGGTATGTGVMPMDPALPAKFDLQAEGLETTKLAKDLRVPFRIEGKANGTLQGTLLPAKKGESRSATLNLDFKAPKLRVQNIPTEQLHGTINYQNGVLAYELEGKTLGGTFDLEGQIPGAAERVKEKTKGRFSLKGVRVRRLAMALGLPATDELAGVLGIEMQYSHKDGDAIPNAGTGIVRITNVRWKDRPIAENLQGELAISDAQLRLRNIEGTLANGTMSAQLAYYFRQPNRSWFSLSLDNVESGLLLSPWLGDRVEGPVEARIRGNLGDGWRGSANFDVTRGKVLGMSVSQWRLPATWSFHPDQNRGQIDIYDSSATVARGRATGKMSFAWDAASARTEGSIRFANAEFKELLRGTIGPSDLASGQTTGRIDFSGTNVRSMNDLVAKIVLAFNQAQALQLPVLQQISPFLGIGATTTFHKGTMLARLERGVFRMEQVTLQGANVQLYLDGTASLEGRLNLEVIARTNTLGIPADRLRLLGLRIPIAGPVPLVVIQEATALLSNRLIYLQVTGTPRSPVIRPRPLPILRDAAIRYFLDRAGVPTLDLP